MTPNRTAIAVFALMLIGGLSVWQLMPTGVQTVPDITLTTLQGKKLHLPALHGRPVLVNFWATTCRVCIEEMPQLVTLYQELAPQGLEVIGVAMAYDRPDRVVAFSTARQIPYPITLDINNHAAAAFGDVHLTPTSFLIAPDGHVVHRETGALDIPRVRELLAAMLAQAPATESQHAVN